MYICVVRFHSGKLEITMEILIIILIVVLAINAYIIARAPRGYENKTGFHYGEEKKEDKE